MPKVALGVALFNSAAAASGPSQCQLTPSTKPRVFILSDIANEPDDAQSFVRLMVYSHELRLQGLVATTSIWLNDTTRPDQMHDIIDAYAEALPNLQAHASDWPEPSYLHDLVASSLPVYGMDGVGEGKDSDGSQKLIDAVDAAVAAEEPVYVPIWGGASVLAQALWNINVTRSPAEIDRFVSAIRAYAISDQDNTGTWIRRNWPQMFYIASVHHFNRYAAASWAGISGDAYYHFPSEGANKEVISKEWIRDNIQSAGPLGSRYPETDFIVEGDTPSLLYLIPNGLSDPEYPEWGSWGGRFGPVCYGEGHYADSVDSLISEDGAVTMGSHLTVWRWRDAFQKDFAARMGWGVTPEFEKADHAPIAAINGDRSRNVIKMTVDAGAKVILDATDSCDPDGDNKELSYKWWQYREPSSNNNAPWRDVASLELKDADQAKVEVTIPSHEVLRKVGRNTHPEADKHLHLILEVSDGKLTSYRRVVFTNVAPEATGQSEHDEL
ncbi:uncharacterized protein DNG_10082 [Cephalotrichum gorgonifer]|uniref:Cellulose-binding protein n=1 Tax=Cephalotrichum gorgonifer TaxID=2041049 RepID=A0AAE8N8K1_9PEZI|nr:uncharacterized protein DNG_10082 [Cephalotrichum gorgonifer]